MDRFWEKVIKSESCWEWIGSRNSDGYGNFWLNGRLDSSHRASWKLNCGPIPEGLWVLHHCDNPGCVRPDHLFLGTRSENMKDALRKGISRIDGDFSPTAKLTSGKIREIRREISSGTPIKTVAGKFGISPSHCYHIRTGYRWKLVPEDK